MSSKIKQLVPLLLDWFDANARDLPWRRTRDPYAIHVSEIMLQQTQVKTVIPYWQRWMRELPTVQAAAQARPDKLHKLWEGLGYYTRVRNLQKAAQSIVERHGGKFPEQFAEVLELPGVGRYTAGAICSIAFNQPVPILDGNVMRVLTRVFGVAENPREKRTNEKLWALATELVRHAGSAGGPPGGARTGCRNGGRDQKVASKAGGARRLPTGDTADCQSVVQGGAPGTGRCSALNQSLMELGALVCTPRNPRCPECPLRQWCVALAQDRVSELPKLGARGRATARHFVAFVVRRDGQFLVRQRPAGVVNAHLWEFPNQELDASWNGATPPAAVVEVAKAVLGFVPDRISPLITVKHSITRYRMTLEACLAEGGGGALGKPGGQWKTPAQLRRLAFAAAHKKVLRFWQKSHIRHLVDTGL